MSAPASAVPGHTVVLLLLLMGVAKIAAAGTGGPEWQAWRQWTTRDGLPHAWILALHQDRQGSIVAGTAAGAARFDGRNWEVLDLPPPLQRAAIGVLAEDGAGRLWIGSDRAGGWREVDDGGYERLPLPDVVSTVHAMAWVDDAMLVGTEAGLHRCATDCQPYLPTLTFPVRSMLRESSPAPERLWLGTQGGGLWVAERRTDGAYAPPVRVVGKAEGLPNDVVLALARFGSGETLWIGTGRGVARWDGEELLAFDGKGRLPVAMTFGFGTWQSTDGEPLAIATLRPGGMLEFQRSGRWRIHGPHYGLPAQSVQVLLRERYRDALWLGTVGGGVLRAERGRWAVLDERAGLPDRLVTGLGQIGGRLWVGTASGAVVWQDDAFVPLAPQLGTAAVNDVAETSAGDRWYATSLGVHRFARDGRHEHFTVDNSSLPGVVASRLAIAAGKDGEAVYIATAHGLARWTASSNGIEVVRGDQDWLADAAVLDLAARDGVLAVATSRGLAIVSNDRWWRSPADCLEGDVAIAAAFLADGRLATISRDGHLLLVRGGRCEIMGEARAIGAPSRLLLDGDGLLVFGARGAERVSLRNPGPGGQRVHFGPDDGLEHGDVLAATRDAQGRIFAATGGGVQVFDPRSRGSKRELKPAPLVITRASHGDPPEPLRAGMRLGAGTTTVAFEYRLRSFEREHAHRYRVRLDGLAAPAADWSNEAQVRYERLPAGHYTFHVEALDADGVAAAPVELGFTIEARWWQRTPWQLLIAAMLVAAGAQIGRWRVARATRRAEALEAEVERRTRDLASANARLGALAITDALTGLHNRRYFAEIEEALARRDRVLVGLVDIDHFKRINDTFGHDGGDAVLIDVARAMADAVGPGGHVFRWGGEEFLVLWPDVPATQDDRLIRRLLEAVASVRLPDSRAISASAGFDSHERDAGRNRPGRLSRVLARADKALYEAKRAGRDRAVLYTAAGQIIVRPSGQPAVE